MTAGPALGLYLDSGDAYTVDGAHTFAAALSPIEVAAALQRYEGFRARVVSDVADLALKEAALRADLQELQQLVDNTQDLAKRPAPCSVMVDMDVGSQVIGTAHVPDASRISLDVGLGFWVEVPLEEVPRVVAPRQAVLRAALQDTQAKARKARSVLIATERSLAQLSRSTA